MKTKKWLISVFLVLALTVSVTIPAFEVQAETEWSKLDRQIEEIRKQKKEAAENARSTDRQINEVQEEQESLEDEIEVIDSVIDKTEEKLFSFESNIEDVTNQAKKSAAELEHALKRVDDRDTLLKTRVRLMYRKGNVQYLEVLLGSNSFSDFLQRFGALQKILNSDKKILKDNIEDKDTIEAKKREIDKALADLENLYTEAENLRASLLSKKGERTVRIASLQQTEKELNEYKDEEEEYLEELASKESELIKKQQKLLYSGGKFVWPVPASKRITSEFGMRIHPITGKYGGHKGLDIGRAPGTSTLYGANILAAYDGVVIVASYVSGYGNTVMIDHGSGIWTLYGHIRNGGIKVKVGQKVKKGEKIAEVGSTGRSTGPHLHFEVRKNKTPVNPWEYFNK